MDSINGGKKADAPAAPQPRKATPRGEPAKAAQVTWDLAAKLGETAAELERVKAEVESVRKFWKDTYDTCHAELERVKQQLAIAESCIKNNDAAFETVKQQRDQLLIERDSLEGSCDNYGHRLCVMGEQRDELLAALKQALPFLASKKAIEQMKIAIANAEKEAK